MSKRGNFSDAIFGSAGWLFADLLLALMMLFLAANTIDIKPLPPKLTVTLKNLDLAHCTGRFSNPKCTIIVGETADSLGAVTWIASSDMSNKVVFNPAKGTLLPGRSMIVTISAIPCQNGSFTFSGSREASPVSVLWHCTPPPERLEAHFISSILQNIDFNGLLSGSKEAINNFKNKVKNIRGLQGRSVGLAIVYGGAPSDGNITQAYNIADKVYSILQSLGKEGFAFQRASYYGHLYTLGNPPTTVGIDLYLFMK